MKIKSPKGLLALWASFLAAGTWVLPIGTVLAGPLPCVAAPLSATTPPSPQPVVEVSGAHQVNSIFVASSHCLRVTSSLRIVASSEIVVHGMIIADPGCSIELVAPAITIAGALTCLQAATGDEVEAVGGQGGSIVLSAAFIDLRGAELRAGDGGDGGPSGDGGDGGSVVFMSLPVVLTDGQVYIKAGNGGSGGRGIDGYAPESRNGGDGGTPGKGGAKGGYGPGLRGMGGSRGTKGRGPAGDGENGESGAPGTGTRGGEGQKGNDGSTC